MTKKIKFLSISILSLILLSFTNPLYKENNMNIEQTLSIIKPDAVKKNHIGAILSHYEKANLKIVATRMIHLSTEDAKKFYAIHQGRPFYDELVEFMTSGPVVVSVLEGPNAVLKNREIMGATDPKKAEKGTIRAEFADNVGENAVHGSDSLDNAKIEIEFFFDPEVIFSS
jgi:nucleoside-diphosphate kinase